MKAIRSAIYQKLTNEPAITVLLSDPKAVFHKQAPADAKYPYVIFNRQGGSKIHAFKGTAFRRQTWLVKAVDREEFSNRAEDISEAIDAVLDGGALNVAGQTLADLRFLGDVDYPETQGDQLFHHCGANYRVVLAQ